MTPDFKSIAEKMIAMGGYVHPVRMGEKALTVPGWQNLATRDLSTVSKWAAEDPHANCAVVGKPDGLWLFDDDDNILAEYERSHGPINTYRVRSVSGGTHLYFRQNDASRAMGNISGKNPGAQETWSARVNNRYVIAPGSVAHPDNDPQKPLAQYRVTDRSPVIEAPDAFIEFLKEKHRVQAGVQASAASSGNAKIEKGGRNSYLTSRAGELRNIGCSEEVILADLTEQNELCCDPPLDESEVKIVAHSIGKRPTNHITVFSSGAPAVVDVSNWRAKFRNVSELEQGDPVMLIDGVLQEGICFLGGPASHGKTLIALAMAKAITLGTPLFGLPQYAVKQTCPVLYLIPESGDRPFRKRCEAFGLPTDDRFLVRTITEGACLSLADPDLLEAVRQRHFVVFLDTTRRFNKTTDSNSDAQNQLLVTNINDLRAAGSPCIVPLHHATKAANSKKEIMTLENMLSGTGDFGAMCDQAYGIRRDDGLYNRGRGPLEIELVNLKDRERLGGLTELRLAATYVKAGSLILPSWIDETGNFRVIGDHEAREQNTHRIVALVKAKPFISLPDLVQETGIKMHTVRQTLKFFGWHHINGGSHESPWHQDAGGECPFKRSKGGRAQAGLPPENDESDEIINFG